MVIDEHAIFQSVQFFSWVNKTYISKQLRHEFSIFAKKIAVECARSMMQNWSLIHECLDDFRMTMTLIHGRVTAEKIEILFAIDIPKEDSLSAFQHSRDRGIIVTGNFWFAFNNLAGVRCQRVEIHCLSQTLHTCCNAPLSPSDFCQFKLRKGPKRRTSKLVCTNVFLATAPRLPYHFCRCLISLVLTSQKFWHNWLVGARFVSVLKRILPRTRLLWLWVAESLLLCSHYSYSIQTHEASKHDGSYRRTMKICTKDRFLSADTQANDLLT